jgi:3-methyladenine DNA glycosylase AlkC
MTMKPHPAQRFQAPSTILTGVPLKEVLGRDLVRLVGESFVGVVPSFDRKRFEADALHGLIELEFNQRGAHIGKALAAQLPTDFDEAAPLLIASLGPELQATEGNGLAVFFYLPHAHVIAERGVERFESGMLANYELTKRMTAEFCIRPFLVRHRDRCLKMLAKWAKDPNPHVRRLVSEGTRSRLPWAMRLKEFQQNPDFTLPLLERLKDDSELYVRRSVANHLADILKDHPDVAFAVCERWIAEIDAENLTTQQAANRRWIVRHAVRLPAKKGELRAIEIRNAAR